MILMDVMNLIAVLRDEIRRQSEADGEAPWIAIDPSGETIRIDGTLDLRKLAEAITSALTDKD